MNATESITYPRPWKALAAFTLVGAAAIHVAVTPQHLHEWVAAGVFFIVLAAAEAAGAGIILSRRLGAKPVARGVVATLTAGTIALWIVSRTVGLPFGPEAGVPEAVGAWDVASTILEALTLLSLWMLARTPTYLPMLARERDAELVRRDRAA